MTNVSELGNRSKMTINLLNFDLPATKRFLVAGFPLSSRTESALGTGADMLGAKGGMPGTESGMPGAEGGIPGTGGGGSPGTVSAGGTWLLNPPER